MAERTTVRLPDDLVRRAKERASEEGRSLTALIEEALRRVLNERPPTTGEPFSLPVSSAGGGLMPGIDLDDMAAIQEIDDLEAARRLR